MFRRTLSLLVALCALSGILLSGALAAGSNTYYIDVDVVNQIVTVYRRVDDAVVRQMICSTGTGGSTPLGTFRMEQSRPDTDRRPWYYITGYRCFVKYASRIKGSILFHSIPYLEKDMDSIDAEALSQLGQRASHGCIRLRWRDAEWIAKHCPDGTVVNIFDRARPREKLRRMLLEEGYSAESGLAYRQFLSIHGDGSDAGLAPGDSGEAVAALQRRLIGLGFFGGDAPTGDYDAATVAAVTRYQSEAGLPVTGVASRALVARAMAEDALFAEYATLTPGCSGTLVAAVQAALRDVGFYDGDIDGEYAPSLRDAALAYCRAAGIEATDRLTPEFRAALYERLDSLNRRYGRGRFSMAVVDGVAHWGVTADAVLDAPMDADSLGVGVMALKRRLREIGCFNGAVTPVYDAATVEAVKAFQKATGLPADGRASLETQRVLFDGESYIEE